MYGTSLKNPSRLRRLLTDALNDWQAEEDERVRQEQAERDRREREERERQRIERERREAKRWSMEDMAAEMGNFKSQTNVNGESSIQQET